MHDSQPDGATPLDADEIEGLLPGHIATRAELDELEEANITSGLEWAMRTAVMSARRSDVLSEQFIFALHKRMFGEVWEWAGQIRRSNKNIGVDKHSIRVQLKALIEDTRYWRDHTVYSTDEIAVRFHHRLVAIHPFPNGNGRHARLTSDIIALQAGRNPFSWGGGRPISTSELRSAYIAALRTADDGEITPLLEFARS